jgi:hypothetical protein
MTVYIVVVLFSIPEEAMNNVSHQKLEHLLRVNNL